MTHSHHPMHAHSLAAYDSLPLSKREAHHKKNTELFAKGWARRPEFDLTGKKIGRWMVVSRAENMDESSAWECKCDCGMVKIIRGTPLRNGKSTSCGCKAAELTSIRARTHGWKGTKTYRVWSHMKERCHRKNHKSFCDYGGRGIRVSDRWLHFENFLHDMGPVPDGMSIERINTNGDYEPSNCRWATPTEQARNRRNTHFLTWNGETKCLPDWADDPRCLVGYAVLLNRINRGWPVDIAMIRPRRAKNYNKNGWRNSMLKSAAS